MFVKVTEFYSGKPIILNLDMVKAVYPPLDHTEGCRLYFPGTDTNCNIIHVRQSFDKMWYLIDSCSSPVDLTYMEEDTEDGGS